MSISNVEYTTVPVFTWQPDDGHNHWWKYEDTGLFGVEISCRMCGIDIDALPKERSQDEKLP